MVQRLVRRRQGGFNYVITMFVVAVVSAAAMHGVENMLTKAKREKEAQLMWVGRAYRDAIKSYYENSPGTVKTYPPRFTSITDGCTSNTHSSTTATLVS
jgi:type II secretory pathway pseudopilin PulG